MPRKKKTSRKKGPKKVLLNTTIREDIFKAFREKCQEVHIPMNLFLEGCMQQFIDGQFKIGVIKHEYEIDTELDIEIKDWRGAK